MPKRRLGQYVLFIKKGDIMPTCPMCNEEVSKFKSNSHTIPKWMHEPIYDEKHRAIRIESNKAPSIIQDGKKGDFICRTCEEKTGELDRYATKILKPQKLEEIIKTSKLDGLLCIPKNHIKDFKKFQNFIFSIFLRDYFYSIKYFPNYSISSNDGLRSHMGNVLEIYNGTEIDFDSYPISIAKININEHCLSNSDPNINYSVRDTVQFKHGGHYFHAFTACGLIFLIKLSSHDFPDWAEVWIQENKDIIIMPTGEQGSQALLSRLEEMVKK